MLRIINHLLARPNKKWWAILLIFLGVILFSWFISIAIAPLNKLREFQKLVYTDSVFIERFDSIYYHPEMSKLVKEKAYKKALLKLTENDSIQLVINLSDSTVNLSIKGVMIHQTKVEKFRKDKLLERISLIQQYRLFSQPLLVHSSNATIVKEPVVVRHAPKDTVEAALNAWQPDTLIQNPAFAAISVEYNIQVIFEQDINKRFYDKWKKLWFYNHLCYKKVITSLENFIRFKRQEYQPKITIKIPVDDLRAIYRALPNNTLIVLAL